MMDVPALMGRGQSVMKPGDKPSLDIPIVLCPDCKRWPMAIKSVHQRLLKKTTPTDVELTCPKCGVSTTVTAMPAAARASD